MKVCREAVMNHNTDIVTKFKCKQCLKMNLIELLFLTAPIWLIPVLMQMIFSTLSSLNMERIEIDFRTLGFWVGIGFFFVWVFLSMKALRTLDSLDFSRAFDHAEHHTTLHSSETSKEDEN